MIKKIKDGQGVRYLSCPRCSKQIEIEPTKTIEMSAKAFQEIGEVFRTVTPGDTVEVVAQNVTLYFESKKL